MYINICLKNYTNNCTDCIYECFWWVYSGLRSNMNYLNICCLNVIRTAKTDLSTYWIDCWDCSCVFVIYHVIIWCVFRTSSCSSLSLFWSPTVQCVALFSLICTVTRTAWMWIKHIQRRSFVEMEFELTIDISISSIQPIT